MNGVRGFLYSDCIKDIMYDTHLLYTGWSIPQMLQLSYFPKNYYFYLFYFYDTKKLKTSKSSIYKYHPR